MHIRNFLTLLIKGKANNVFLQLFRYTFVGGFAFVVDFGLLYILTEYTALHYLLSTSLAFIAGLIVNYAISKLWVFDKSAIRMPTMEFIVFTIIGITGLAFTDLLMWLFTEKVGMFYMHSKVITTIIVFFWNFFARKYIIFK